MRTSELDEAVSADTTNGYNERNDSRILGTKNRIH
jgi:hypothetical protein